MDIIGKPMKTRVLYYDLDYQSPWFEPLKDVIDLLIKAMLKFEVLFEEELNHIYYNKSTKRYENE